MCNVLLFWIHLPGEATVSFTAVSALVRLSFENDDAMILFFSFRASANQIPPSFAEENSTTIDTSGGVEASCD